MRRTIIIIGLGQLGLSFARGFLKLGHPVIPVHREDHLEEAMISHLEEPLLILMAVGEDDLAPAMKKTTSQLAQLKRKAEFIFLQNELRPDQWLSYCEQPTVSVVWFEQKAGKLPHEVQPSLHFGPAAALCDAALKTLNLGSEFYLETNAGVQPALAEALILKNLYILILNLGGLRAPGTAAELYKKEASLFTTLFDELFRLESALLHQVAPELVISKSKLQSQLIAAILADPDHGCAGRSAPRRLERTLAHAERLQLQLPTVQGLAHECL